MEVFRRGLGPDEDDLLSSLAHLLRGIRIEDDLAIGRSRRGRQSGRQEIDVGFRVDHRVEQLIELRRLDTGDGRRLVDQSLPNHLNRNPHRRLAGPLGVARLQHVELALLDGELEVLDIGVVLLEPLGDFDELVIDARHLLLELRDLLRGPNAGDDILSLGVLEVLSVEDPLPGRDVTREGDPGPGVLAEVSEGHHHDVDPGSEVVGDLVHPAIIARPAAIPRLEDGLDRQTKLLVGVGREILSGLAADDRLVVLDQLREGLGPNVGVFGDAQLLLVLVELVLKLLGVDAENDLAEELDEAAICVVGEALIAGQLRQGSPRLVVQSKVENGVHHPRHRELRARTDRDEQWALGSPKLLSRHLFDPGHRLENLRPDVVGDLLSGPIVGGTGFGRHGEARRHRQSRAGHLGQPCPFPTEQVLHRARSLGHSIRKQIDVFRAHRIRSLSLGICICQLSLKSSSRKTPPGRGHQPRVTVDSTGRNRSKN